ncbi:MAG TPA: response regulator [Pyrinomonadaceae bacterium]|nr:response regulator [Pyrinomonadaceae bacterium]
MMYGNVCFAAPPATIFFALPDQTHPRNGKEPAKHSLPSDIGEAVAQKPRALVVDDVPDVTEMLAFLLRGAGYEVTTASSAKAALETARNRLFDVVISDIGMPEMDGYDLAAALRKLPDYQAVPLVALTGFAMFDDRERSLRSGFDAHMTKPVEPTALLDLLEQLRT